MFLSAKAFFDDNTDLNIRLLYRAENTIPAEFIKRYKKNVVKITPKKTGALRRSIITQQLGKTANISWRSRYAMAQEKGDHYVNYTTEGTGAHFGARAWESTQKEMPAVFRELGLTK